MKLYEISRLEQKVEAIKNLLIYLSKDPLSKTYNYETGVLNVDGQFVFQATSPRLPYKKLPVKFGVVKDNFMVSNLSNLESLENFPDEIGGSLYCGHTKISSFEGLTPKIGRHISCINSKNFKSLVGVDKHIKQINGQLSMSFDLIKEGGLGLLNVRGLQSLQNCGNDATTKLDLPEPFLIIQKHLITRGERDIFECQSELIDAGYEEYAKL